MDEIVITEKKKRKYVRICPEDNDAIGKIGEHIASSELLRNNIFDVECLGGKVPSFDLICTIKDKDYPFVFLVQVKASYDGNYTKTDPICLHTPVKEDKIKGLARPLPTYVAGVDNAKNKVYIAPAFADGTVYPSVPVKYELSRENPTESLKVLNRLKDDVVNYWSSEVLLQYKKKFKSALKYDE